MMINNELGTVQPVEKAVTLVREKAIKNKVCFHVDGVQAVGMIPVIKISVIRPVITMDKTEIFTHLQRD